MKNTYLRHEYTWSGRCISGNRLGWGIVASSAPKEKQNLRELEKMAAAAMPDRRGVSVEELAYSPVTGFVKMVTFPAKAGEDNRENKLVEIYQPEKKTMEPGIYLAPAQGWQTDGEKSDLSKIQLEEISELPEKILTEFGLYDRLPEFLRVVFLCLSQYPGGIIIEASSWKEKDFCQNARRLMYALHSLLPRELRKKAGYRAPVKELPGGIPFCFAGEALGKDYFSLETFEGILKKSQPDVLENYFYEYLAEYYVKNHDLYDEFMGIVSKYLEEKKAKGLEMQKVQWLFYGFARKHGKESLSKEYLFGQLPQLFYWSIKEEVFQEITEEIRWYIHSLSWSEEETLCYMDLLLDGMTKSTKEIIGGELDWLLQKEFERNAGEAVRRLEIIRVKNNDMYTWLLSRGYDRKGSYSEAFFVKSMETFASMEEYLFGLQIKNVPDDMKDQVIRDGIRLLNKELFCLENYQSFDRIMNRLERKRQWVVILRDFVSQLEERAELFEDDQLNTACYVESLLKRYDKRSQKGILHREKLRRRRKAEQEPEEEEMEKGSEEYQKKEKQREIESGAEEMDAEYAEAWEAGGGSFTDFLMTVAPQGFLTGCIMYLSNYSIMIGHWKIAVGMAGMWVLLMLNFISLLCNKKEKYSLWKCIGACVVAGFVIEIAASMLLSQKIRLYYFIFLGIAAVLIQTGNIIRKKGGMRSEAESGEDFEQ